MAFPKPTEKEPSAFDTALAPILDHLAYELAGRVALRLMLDAPNLTPTIPEVLTTTEAAKLLRVHPNTLVEHARAGRVPCNRVGSRWLFRRSSLLKWIDGDFVNRAQLTDMEP